ncbi:hypothetical protein [Streptomyces sp. NBC_01643]|uniref:hypothetical protein n=2 Tax=unclassified Streptomyces TaxID=2593676 RepID=UPI00386375AF|nr:hypothetical protein OHB03_41310 [Streptomyces sp. NBC_01643]
MATDTAGERWLVPGRFPGQHLSRSQLVRRLHPLGVRPRMARNTALVELASELPAVVSRLLGVHQNTADAWKRIGGQDNAYAAEVASRPGLRGSAGIDPSGRLFGRLTLMQLWVAAFVVGSCHVMGMAVSLSYIPHLLPSHRLMEANAKPASANTLADIGGPALAGALIGAIGAARAVAADAAPETARGVLISDAYAHIEVHDWQLGGRPS